MAQYYLIAIIITYILRQLIRKMNNSVRLMTPERVTDFTKKNGKTENKVCCSILNR